MNATVSSSVQTLAINCLRSLAIDAVQRAKSGHPGMPMGCAPMATALWKNHLRYNPANPRWSNRDRFVLSAGHGSALLYSLLFATGYAVSMDDLKQFRQWGSITPGHPENTHTPGVEMATGPLGQGVATAVGMAIAEAFLANRYNRPNFPIVDHHTYVLCSDGDLMEGVAQEACSLAGHLQLGKLVMLYDDNEITIDGSTSESFSENTALKFEALGWHTQHVDGLDVDAVNQAIETAKSITDRPSLILCRTIIGFGSPTKAGSSKSHGAPLGEEDARETKRGYGLPEGSEFYWPEEVASFYDHRAEGEHVEAEWQSCWAGYESAFPAEASEFKSAVDGSLQTEIKWPSFTANIATRNACGECIQAIAESMPTLLGGCADLAGSVMTKVKTATTFSGTDRAGRNIAYGIREHAMAAAVNGITLHGGARAFGGTFLIFSDYCRPSLRLSALMRIPSIQCFSHDSIGLGEDGPTHQPVEQLMSLRLIPNYNVMRPGDAYETIACWQAALTLGSTPSAIVTSRQNLELLSPAQTEGHPALRGGYILRGADIADPQVNIVATGSELGIAVDAWKQLSADGVKARVVSLPSWFLFDEQSPDYRQSVLPTGVPTISVEAGSTLGWSRYAQAHIGLDHFGASAPGDILFQEFGITAAAIVHRAKQMQIS